MVIHEDIDKHIDFVKSLELVMDNLDKAKGCPTQPPSVFVCTFLSDNQNCNLSNDLLRFDILLSAAASSQTAGDSCNW